MFVSLIKLYSDVFHTLCVGYLCVAYKILIAKEGNKKI